MRQDFRLAVRMLLKQPGFSLIAILTLALGIGATSAVFSLIQGVLLTPPPYREPERLVLMPAARSDGQPEERPRSWSAQQWKEWQAEAKSFESIAAYGWTFNFLVEDNASESLEGMRVTHEYFRTMGVKPVLGRAFLESETGPAPAPVALIGYDLWQRKFHGDPKVIGQKLRMSRMETPPEIVGVLPPGVRFLPSPSAAQEPNYNVNAPVDILLAAGVRPDRLKQRNLNLVGRLRKGATIERAQAELAALAKREGELEPDFAGFFPKLESLTSFMNKEGNRILLPLFGAAGLVLLIACGNVVALLLVRGLQRQQEYAVRSALGVGRKALFRQVSAESLLLALLGGTLGVALAFGIVQVLKQIGGHAIPRLDAVTTGWPVLLGGLVSAIVAALVAGLIPAMRASRQDPMGVLKSGGSKSSAGIGERRILRAITLGQTALTLALLVGAGLLIQTMMNLSQVKAGYDTSRILTMSVTSLEGNSGDFHRRALERVAALPGVRNVAFAWGVPLTGNSWPGVIDVEGQPLPTKESERISMPLRSVTPGYFALLGQPIREGRDVRATDDGKAPRVAVVNQAFADRFFPGGNAIGKKVWMGRRDQPPNEIVGVAANGRTSDLTQPAEPELYFSFWQVGAFSKHLVVRTSADPHSLMAAVQRELRAVSPVVAVENLKTLEDIRGDSLAPRNFAMQLLVGFSLAGGVLTLVGIYGVLSLSVASRRREIAIRNAVGAQNSDIRNMVFGEGFRLIAGGIVAGLAAAVVLSRVLQSFLYGVEPGDPVTLAGVGVLFAVVALLACWVPTRRATKVDPLEALRYE